MRVGWLGEVLRLCDTLTSWVRPFWLYDAFIYSGSSKPTAWSMEGGIIKQSLFSAKVKLITSDRSRASTLGDKNDQQKSLRLDRSWAVSDSSPAKVAFCPRPYRKAYDERKAWAWPTEGPNCVTAINMGTSWVFRSGQADIPSLTKCYVSRTGTSQPTDNITVSS